MGNIHFYEILDWVLGWAGYDITKDDWATRIAAQEEKAPEPPSEAPPEKQTEKPTSESTVKPSRRPSEESPGTAENPPPRRGKKRELHELVP